MTSSTSSTTATIPPQLAKAAPYFAFALAVFAAYGNVYDNVFVVDDKVLILQNAFLRDWHSIPALLTTTITAGAGIAGGFYRPLQMLIYFLLYQVVGASSFAFHLLDIALHVANACLLYRLGDKLGFNKRAAFFAVLLWALHPVQVEAVAYMSGTADPLYVLFSLIALLILLPDFSVRKNLLALPFFFLALLSKEDALVLPLLAMSCLFLIRRRCWEPMTYKRTGLLWIAAILYALAHRYLLSFGGYQFYPDNLPYTSSILVRIYTCLATLPTYLGLLVWPTHLHYYRNIFPVLDPWNAPVLGGLAIVILAATQIALGRTRAARVLSWSFVWCAAAHILHTGIFVPLNSMLLEHWLYLPSAGLFLGIGETLTLFPWKHPHRIGGTLIALGLALMLGMLTYQQNAIWHDEEGFYLNIFANGEPSLEAHNNFGSYYSESGNYEKAIEQFSMVIGLSHDLNAPAEYNLAVDELLLNNDNPAEVPDAIAHMKRALELDPDFYIAADKLAILYGRLGDKANAALYRARANALRAKLMHEGP